MAPQKSPVKLGFNTSDDLEMSKLLLASKDRILKCLSADCKISVSKFNLSDHQLLYSATSVLSHGSQIHYGHGHSDSPVVASSKAFGEAIERFLAFRYMNGQRLLRPNTYRIEYTENGGLNIAKPESDTQSRPLPPLLRSSNGWALHFSEHSAIANGVQEAMERSFLQIMFLASGWDNFVPHESHKLHNRNLNVWLSRNAFYGLSAGIIECSLICRPGRTFGYFLRSAKDPFVFKNFMHAAFEALEPAIYLDDNPDYKPRADDLVAVAQFKFAQKRNSEIFGAGPTRKQEIRAPDCFRAEIFTFDLSTFFGVRVPLHLAWCFGGDTIPLLLKNGVQGENRSYIETSLDRYNLIFDENCEIPVV